METLKIVIKKEEGQIWLVFVHKDAEIVEEFIDKLSSICPVETRRASYIIRSDDGWHYYINPICFKKATNFRGGPFCSFSETIDAELSVVENNLENFKLTDGKR